MSLSRHELRIENGFRLRGTAISRLEVFSDVIFGLALTLLVVSLQVPKNFGELRVSVRGFVPFAICFGLFSLLWHAHYKFFRRYALEDRATLALNSFLLFVVLFYVYVLIAPWKVLTGVYFGRKVRLLEKLVEAPG